MSLVHSEALQRAHQSLIGLVVGDALGAFFEFSHGRLSRRITERILPGGVWHWIDDTQMAHEKPSHRKAVSEWFARHYRINVYRDRRHMWR